MSVAKVLDAASQMLDADDNGYALHMCEVLRRRELVAALAEFSKLTAELAVANEQLATYRECKCNMVRQ